MSKFGFDKKLEMMPDYKKVIAVKVANQAQRFFLSSFKNEAWDDDGMNKWANRKDATNTKALLVNKGTLRKAVADSVREATWDHVLLIVDVPYAKYQNQGTGRIPQRKFMGNSNTLLKKQRTLIKKEFSKLFNKK